MVFGNLMKENDLNSDFSISSPNSLLLENKFAPLENDDLLHTPDYSIEV